MDIAKRVQKSQYEIEYVHDIVHSYFHDTFDSNQDVNMRNCEQQHHHTGE